jgi:hypothetical protein
LLISPEPPGTALDLLLPQGVESSHEQDLREIYKLVSGSSGLATWDEIYAKLITNLHSIPVRENPQATEGKTDKNEGTVLRLREPEGNPELKSRSGGPFRRRLWL